MDQAVSLPGKIFNREDNMRRHMVSGFERCQKNPTRAVQAASAYGRHEYLQQSNADVPRVRKMACCPGVTQAM